MKRRHLFLGAAMALVLAVTTVSVALSQGAGTTVRWDIVTIDFENGTVGPGGIASAFAADGSKITLTGKGTFRPGDFRVGATTGGGTWTTLDADGNETGSGSYFVTRLFRWKRAPGDPPPLEDNVPGGGEPSAGLVYLKIRFDDGEPGTLVVSCHLVGTPDTVFEGITASKGYVDYFNAEPPPAPPGDANRTVFHVRS